MYIYIYEPGSKLVVLGMVIPPLIGNPYNGYINPYYWVDDHPLLYGNNGSLDPSTYISSLRYISKYTPPGSSKPSSYGKKNKLCFFFWVGKEPYKVGPLRSL